MYLLFHVKIRVKSTGHCTVSADLLQRRRGTVRHRTVLGLAPADVFIYRRRTAPVRYVTTQEKISKKSSGARAIIKFAGDVHIAEIVRYQFYL